MAGKSGYGIRPVKVEDVDLEVPKARRLNSVCKIAETGVLLSGRITKLSKNPRPLENLYGTPNLKSVFSDKPDPSVHGHRLKRRANNPEKARQDYIDEFREKNKEKAVTIVRRKTLAAEARDIQDLARQFSIRAMEELVNILDNPDAADSAKLTAINMILDRGYGKAAVTMLNLNASVDAKPSELDSTSLDKRIADAITRVEKLTGNNSEELNEEQPINIREYN
jgi:hypothetical protein